MMSRLTRSTLLTAALLIAPQAWSDNDRLEAAVGGAIGGGAGAAIGEELGGRDGAIIGGAIGGAVGAAIATDDDDHGRAERVVVRPVVISADGHPGGRHCPPGQAKKGRC